MTKYRQELPQLDGRLFLTDGDIKTTLVFQEGEDLPLFAAFDLLKDPAGRAALRRYYGRHAAIAHERGNGFILESPTSRCSHAEPDEAEILDAGDPVESGLQYADLRRRFPWINVRGGCCGTDHRHIEQISIACRTPYTSPRDDSIDRPVVQSDRYPHSRTGSGQEPDHVR